MKTTAKIAGLMFLAAVLAAAGCAKRKVSLWKDIKDPAVAAQLQSFVAQKEAQGDAATNASVPAFAALYAAATRGDGPGVNSAFEKLRNSAGQYQHTGATDERIRGTKWQGAMEIWGAFDAFGHGNEKYSAIYANDIITSIPPGSIYFGGTDPGRFVITAMQKSQVEGDPFFTLTQNALADGTYLDYLRNMYGDRIYIPTPEDSQKCFEDYYADVQERMKNHKLDPGEIAQVDPITGKLQVTGQVAVMNINGLIAKVVFDKETNREFYVEESFPLAWMYPYLEPHGLIFKINHRPLAELSDDIVNRDHDYWSQTISPMIGDWLEEDTSIADIAAFNEKVFLNHDFSGFTGDTNFILDTYGHRMFSKERSSIGGLYAWRVSHTDDPSEKERMNRAADFAFRQAWALCPYSPEAVFRYAQFLMEEKRSADALLVAETAAKFPGTYGASNAQIKGLVTQLRQYQHR